MHVVVVYESMYGNTHTIASAIGKGFEAAGDDVMVVPVHEADRALVDGADLLVVGGPTHAHSMSRESTRQSAVEMAAKPDSGLTLDEDAEGDGLREWFEATGRSGTAAAAFDTRISMAPILTGRASKAITKQLRHHGYDVVVEPESFLVTKDNHLEPGEEARAEAWGTSVSAAIRATAASRS